jgi:hypothetical protein
VAWLAPVTAVGADDVPALPAELAVVVTADPPEVTWTTLVVPWLATVPAAAVLVVVVDVVAVPGRFAATTPAATRPAAPTASVAARSRARPRWRRTTADRALLGLASIVLPSS